MKKYFRLASLFFVGLIIVVACKKEYQLPTASFTAMVDGSVVTFTATVTNDSKYEWDFGDGSYISTIHAPVHTYSEFGRDFTVSLTIKGPGGQTTVTNKVTIPPKTKLQLLTGGTAAAPASRKWRVSASAPSFVIAAATANFTPVVKTYPGGILAAVGLGAVYGDSFEFSSDGTLTIHPNGGGIFAGYVYCLAHGIPTANLPDAAGAGLAYASPFTSPAGATFQINEGKNFTISTAPDGSHVADVTYPNVMTLSFTKGGFLGILDSTSECIVQSLTDSQMVATLFVSTNYPTAIGVPNLVLVLYFEVAP